MRICVIFNPTARGEKAKRFRRYLDLIAGECALKQTVCAGAARGLATLAIAEGFDTIVAAGGDGTLNEVLNGIVDAPNGLERARLGVLPLGTVNVFAKEMGLPMNLRKDWEILRAGRETQIDLPCVEFQGADGRERRCFAQLAGAGLDARAIELVDWQLKKKIGPLAYVWAGFRAWFGPPARITAANGKDSATGELVLIGNGRFYGGKFRIFPRAKLVDGRLDVCVIPKITLPALIRSGLKLLTTMELPSNAVRRFEADTFTLTGESPTPLEVDGEGIGHLPATFTMLSRKLRVVVP